MNILHLNLIKVWFDMILSGDKTEEYREITEYWAVRLIEGWNRFKPSAKKILLQTMNNTAFSETELKKCIELTPKKFDQVHFKNGMARNGKPAPSFDIGFDGLRVDTGLAEWGAELGKLYFVIGVGLKK